MAYSRIVPILTQSNIFELYLNQLVPGLIPEDLFEKIHNLGYQYLTKIASCSDSFDCFTQRDYIINFSLSNAITYQHAYKNKQFFECIQLIVNALDKERVIIEFNNNLYRYADINDLYNLNKQLLLRNGLSNCLPVIYYKSNRNRYLYNDRGDFLYRTTANINHSYEHFSENRFIDEDAALQRFLDRFIMQKELTLYTKYELKPLSYSLRNFKTITFNTDELSLLKILLIKLVHNRHCVEFDDEMISLNKYYSEVISKILYCQMM